MTEKKQWPSFNPQIMHYFVVDRTSVYVGLTQTPDQPTTDCTHKKIGLKRPPKKDSAGL